MGNFIYSVDMYIFKDGDFINKKNIIMTEKSQDSLTAFRSIIEKYGLKKHKEIILDDPIVDTAYGKINGYDIEMDISQVELNSFFNIDKIFDTVEKVNNIKSMYLITKITCTKSNENEESVSVKTVYFTPSLQEGFEMMDKLEDKHNLTPATPPINILNRFRTRKDNLPDGFDYYVLHRVDHKE